MSKKVNIKKADKGYKVKVGGNKVAKRNNRGKAESLADRIRGNLGKRPTMLNRTSDQNKPQYSKRYSRSGDKKRKAMPPGKRLSKNGEVYYAYREDHTDRNMRKKI